MTIKSDAKLLVRLESHRNVDYDNYPVQIACEYGHAKVVKLLIDSGLRMSTIAGAVMRAACCKGHLDVVAFLIECKCGFLEDGLWAACSNGQKDVVELLPSQGVDLSVWRSRDALCHAVVGDHNRIVRLLLDTSADF
ncbi:hypothetical protein HDU93_003048, partial [Gonapodya sp. JEL0774]